MKKSTYAAVGKNGPEDKLVSAFNKVVGYHSYAPTMAKRDSLIKGAVDAFHDGRPENIQTIFAEYNKIRLAKGADAYYEVYQAALMLNDLSATADDKSALIDKALEKIPAVDKKNMLSHMLERSVKTDIGDELFYASLVKSGASFDDALALAYNDPSKWHKDEYIKKLNLYQKAITPQKPVSAESPSDLLSAVLQMQEQMVTLTQEVRDLKALMEPRNAIPSEKTIPAQEKKTYPAIKGL